MAICQRRPMPSSGCGSTTSNFKGVFLTVATAAKVDVPNSVTAVDLSRDVPDVRGATHSTWRCCRPPFPRRWQRPFVATIQRACAARSACRRWSGQRRRNRGPCASGPFGTLPQTPYHAVLKVLHVRGVGDIGVGPRCGNHGTVAPHLG